MKIYTSYFGNIKNLIKNNIVPIGICCYPPKWFNGINLTSLAPTPDILESCKSSHNEYKNRYLNEVLSVYTDISILLNRIEYISEGKDVALCCFEKPDEFCHRYILAEWLSNKANIAIEEYNITEKDKIKPLF